MNYRRLFVLLALPVLLLSFLLVPAYAAVDYNDYISNVVVDGSNDLVTCTIPANDVHWAVVRSGVNYFSGDGPSFVTREPLPSMSLADIYSSWFYKDRLILSNIPNETSLSGRFNLKLHFSPASNADSDFQQSIVIHYLDSSGKHISYDTIISDRVTIPSSGVLGFDINFPFDYILDKPDGAAFAYFETRFYFYSGHTGSVTISGSVSDLTMNMSISSLYRLQQQTGKTNQLLEQVEDQLVANGEKFDDIISGGSAGDDLMAGSDKLEDAGAGLGDSIGDISDFEDTYMGQLDDQLPNILASVDLNYLVSPLAFVKMYTDKIIAGVPSQYLLIFTLPALFGIFFYIVGHPIRAPKPDTSGDVVTRETFTTTTVLTGKHAGQTSTVRTVTQSQEIGRVSGAGDN